MTFSIRRVREQDAASIVELLNPLIEAGTYTVMDEPVSVAEQVAFIRGFPERGVFNVAVCDDSRRILGIQDVVPVRPAESAFRHVGEISTFVALDAHRRGVGRGLSQVTFQEARERGFLKIGATIRADNRAAVSFYRSQGFRIIGTAGRHAFLRGRFVDEILMERLID
ncbi:MAG: GNAT family N-acetyltransferase [Planctomycetota bacterium]|jgi:L-amino acid N-acyltransferase YncA